MKKDTIAANKDSVKRHLQIPTETYKAMEEEITIHNRVHDLTKRDEKRYLQDMMPDFMADGVAHRRRKVFVHKNFRDKKWKELYTKATAALAALHKHESTLY